MTRLTHPFPIVVVPKDALRETEAMGSKVKFWYDDKNLGTCLYKEAREKTGEDWSEKIAAELADLLGLPHARYELAACSNRRGSISISILPSDTALIHGNDILAALIADYSRDQKYRQTQHTWRLVLRALGQPGVNLPLDWTPPDGINSAIAVFVGYLMLDAWIGNSDRHHENWGYIYQQSDQSVFLAPTYDHASCLGRELLDSKRLNHLESGTVASYAKKARSAFYEQVGDRKALLTFELFCKVAQRYSQSAKIWLTQLARISEQEVQALFDRLPTERITPTAAQFACKMLEFNRTRLIEWGERLN